MQSLEKVASTQQSMFWLVSGCAFTSMASMRICDAMLPALSQEFGISAGQAASAISAFALAYGVLQLVYGPLGDRFGKTRVIGTATLACSLGSALVASAGSLEWLVLSRALSGAAAAGIIPLTMAWIGDTVAYEERQPVLARLLGATVFGMICGQWAGGLLADVLDWRSAFWGLTLIFCASGALLLKHASAAPRQAAPAAGGVWRAYQAVLQKPWAQVVLLVTAMEGAFAVSALAFIPSYLHLRFGLAMPVAGGLVALYGIGGLLYSRTARWMLQRWGEQGLARLGGLATGLAYGSIALAPDWQWVPPACLLAGFGFYALHNTLQTNATQMSPTHRGTAVSLFACCLFFGQSLGVVAAGWVTDHFSARAVFATSGLGLLVLGLVFAGAVQRRARAGG